MSLKSDPIKYDPPVNGGEDASNMLRGVAKPTGKMNDTNSTDQYSPPKVKMPKPGGTK